MLKRIKKYLNINQDPISKLGNLSHYLYDELVAELSTMYPELETKILHHEMDAFSASFITLEFKLTILYSNDGKYVSTMSLMMY